MGNGHGGTRPGAGRKPKATKFESEIAAAELQIAQSLPEVIAAQIDLATGVTVQEVDPKTGGLKVYTRAPDAKAGQYIIDRILGKPTQRIETDDDPDGTIEAAAEELAQARRELEQWRKQQIDELSNMPNVLPTPPMPATPTES